MPGIEHGIERGIGVVVEAVVVAVILGEVVPRLVEAGLLPPGLFSGIVVLSIVGIILTVDASRYCSYGYLAGFVIGAFWALPVLSQTEFLGITHWILYGGAAVGAIILRIKIHNSSL